MSRTDRYAQPLDAVKVTPPPTSAARKAVRALLRAIGIGRG